MSQLRQHRILKLEVGDRSLGLIWREEDHTTDFVLVILGETLEVLPDTVAPFWPVHSPKRIIDDPDLHGNTVLAIEIDPGPGMIVPIRAQDGDVRWTPIFGRADKVEL